LEEYELAKKNQNVMYRDDKTKGVPIKKCFRGKLSDLPDDVNEPIDPPEDYDISKDW
jgi:hypothetical protein